MSSIRIGTAPCSWGVWFADDPRQPSYTRFLDEAAAIGYRWIELGPYGYLPTDPLRLRDELDARGLSVAAGTVFEHLHRDGSWDQVWGQVRRVAALTAAVGGRHLVVIPQMWRDPGSGVALSPRRLTAAQWIRKTAGMDRLGQAVADEFGLTLQFHPHADTHITLVSDVLRFLEDTDPRRVGLCLDTGHIGYAGGDSLDIIAKYPARIGYLHLKQVDPAVRATVAARDLPFGAAVAAGVMVEPPLGLPEYPPILAAVHDIGADVFAIVEQDLYPCAADVPRPIAQRTRDYLGSVPIPSIRFQ
jgi:inosose dehydratase